MNENTENMTLATELLHELKASAKRWFIAFIIMVVMEIATIVGFIWYISLPTEEYYEVSQDAIQDGNDNSELKQIIGGE